MDRRGLAVFSGQLSFMLRTGVPLLDALSLAGQSSPKLTEASDLLALRVRQGQPLSRAMRELPQVFPDTYTALLEIGERSGTLVGMIERLAQLEERQAELARKLSSAMVYPAILVASFLLTTLTFVTFVMPALNELFVSLRLQLPLATRLLVWVGEILRHPLFLVQLVAIPVFLLSCGPYLQEWLVSPAVRLVWDRFLLSTPGLSIVTRKTVAVRVFYVLGCCLSAGVDVLSSLELAARASGNRVVAAQLMATRKRVEGGERLGEAIVECELLGGIPAGLLKAGEETATLAAMSRTTCALYEMELDLALATATALIEPLMMTVLGSLTAFLFLAAVLPTAQLLSNF
ncbi:MAG: type II secretion system F family protein [Vulcanimicrobiota bacterium]